MMRGDDFSPAQVASRQRPRPCEAAENGSEVRLRLATALPLSVWQDHLVPMLSRVEAGRLRCACKALKGITDECPVDLGSVNMEDLRAALRCFPKAKSVGMNLDETLEPPEYGEMMKLLIQHGETLTRVTATGCGAEGVLAFAVATGGLPKLTYFEIDLADFRQRLPLSMDLAWAALEEVKVIAADPAGAEHMAFIEHLRHFPKLRRLSLIAEEPNAPIPAFIPPSLKSLSLDITPAAPLEALLRELPSMLQASGASLEEIEVLTSDDPSAEGSAALAHVLRTCSPGLKSVAIPPKDGDEPGAWGDDVGSVLVTCCERVERLRVSWRVLASLPPTCPGFARLTSLTVSGTMLDFRAPLWGLTAGGLLPALTALHLCGKGGVVWPHDEDGPLLSRAFEGVAGTLRRLTIRSDFSFLGFDAVCQELGVAIGKLRRLSYLSLQVSNDGRSYQAMGRSLAASGGCPPLFDLHLGSVHRNTELLTQEPSLIVPSVRDLAISGLVTEEDVLSMCCALVRMGYKHRFTCLMLGTEDEDFEEDPCLFGDTVYACMSTILHELGGMNACFPDLSVFGSHERD
jgi:hypothetical protein